MSLQSFVHTSLEVFAYLFADISRWLQMTCITLSYLNSNKTRATANCFSNQGCRHRRFYITNLLFNLFGCCGDRRCLSIFFTLSFCFLCRGASPLVLMSFNITFVFTAPIRDAWSTMDCTWWLCLFHGSCWRPTDLVLQSCLHLLTLALLSPCRRPSCLVACVT